MATIRDVANRAGVSTATVSYVINKSRHVSEPLTARVLAAIEELRFSPSGRARGLRKGTSSTIGVIMDDITNRFAANFTRGLESAASAMDFTTIITDLQKDPRNEARSLSRLLEEGVGGIVYAGLGAAEKQLIDLFQRGTPVVVVDKPLETRKLPSVLIDSRKSIHISMSYLKESGHQHILYIAGLAVNRNTSLRVRAFEEFSREHHLPCSRDCVFYGDYSLEHGYETTLQIIKSGRKFTALLCGDDVIAFAATAALKSRGLRVPEDVAVIGFDDDPMAAVFDPSLTTIHYPMHEMGQCAFQVLHKLLTKKRSRAEHLILDTSLVIRRSTDPTYRDYHTGQ